MSKFPGIKGLIFDEEPLVKKSSRGLSGITVPSYKSRNDGSHSYSNKESLYISPRYLRKSAPRLPEVSEPDAVRHFTRLSQWNMCVDSVFYPLGSCTMKYNPKINEKIASLENIKNAHPFALSGTVQPLLKIIYDFNSILREITGMAEFSFCPQAGAAGEFVGLKIIRKYFDVKGEDRKIVLVPDSSHGTNPASSVLAGFRPVEIKTGKGGRLDAADLHKYMSPEVAGIMITNPNTFGVFEKDIRKISDIMHNNGSLVYMDGANFNAFMGNVRVSDMGADIIQLNLHKTLAAPHGGGGPGSGAVGVVEILSDYLPVPYVRLAGDKYEISSEKTKTIGRISPFLGNFAVLIRAYAYLLSLGRKNIASVSETAVLNANYLKKKIAPVLRDSDPFEEGLCMHECVFSDKALEESGISTLDFAKLLIDYGFHPPTVYFPKNIHGAIMIEPTETESLRTLDNFIKAVSKIKSGAKKTTAARSPGKTRSGRINELDANKNPVFKY